MMKNNKAWAAAVAQALVQLVAAFVPFEPDLEQALGVVLTAGVVWLVPNIEHTPTAGATVTKTPVKASMPAWTMAAALALGLLVSACAALGDKAADALLGSDCGPASRVYRAELLTARVLARYPAVPPTALEQALDQMRAAANSGGAMESAALAYQAALADAAGPAAGIAAGQPVLLRLSLLSGMAQDFLVIRSQLGAFCAARAA
jgi:uncharacterized membrane protein (DUF441 family)